LIAEADLDEQYLQPQHARCGIIFTTPSIYDETGAINKAMTIYSPIDSQ
jgi:hypothetical protein